MLLMFTQFLVVSILLLPIAYMKSLIFKVQKLLKETDSRQVAKRAIVVAEFAVLGPVLMILTFMADCAYFWINNFRTHLKKIVIEVEPSSITKQWIKKIKLLAQKYAFNRIKAVSSIQFVSKFREDIDINSQLQYLVFGQSV